MEAAAEADDVLMEKYLETENLTNDEILQGLREGTLTGVFTPVVAGSALTNIGVRQLLDYIDHCLPSPRDKGTQVGTNPKTGEMEERRPEEDGPFSAMVFKTISDPYTGKLTLFRIYSGDPEVGLDCLQSQSRRGGADRPDLPAGGEKAEADP